jgi:hypothetical protein
MIGACGYRESGVSVPYKSELIKGDLTMVFLHQNQSFGVVDPLVDIFIVCFVVPFDDGSNCGSLTFASEHQDSVSHIGSIVRT